MHSEFKVDTSEPGLTNLINIKIVYLLRKIKI